MAKRSRKKAAREGGAAEAGRGRDWVWGLLLFAAVIVVYQPVWSAGYLWDDDTVLTGNPCIIGPLGLKEIWSTSAADICPLTLTTFWLEHAVWGRAPLTYHLVNVLMQGGCAVVLWRVLRRLRMPGAWLGAALWALHPVQVESVAWITEMKNTESGLCYLLAALFFLRGWNRKFGWNDALMLLFGAMAMAAKSSTVILPLVLLLCGWWMEGRWKWSQVLRISPLLVMSIFAGLVSVWTQRLAGEGEAQVEMGGLERVAAAGEAVWFYLGKLIWPHPLMLVYPLWRIDVGDPLAYLPTLAVVVLLAGLWWRREAWARPWQFCAGYFILALLPVLGVANLTYFAHSLVADHFQYLASMGPLAFLGAGIVRWTDSAPPKWNRPMLAGGALVLILGVLTWERAWAYQSEEEIWNDTLVKNPNSWEAYNNLGLLYASQGREDDAIRNYEKALAVTPKEMGPDPGAPNPPYAQTCNNIGNALLRERKFDAAIGEYRQALSLDAHYAEANNNLGYALLNQGKTAEAIRYFRRALEINPDDAGAHNNLGIALAQTGRMADALAQFREALRLKPDSADARANVSKAEAALGNRPPAR